MQTFPGLFVIYIVKNIDTAPKRLIQRMAHSTRLREGTPTLRGPPIIDPAVRGSRINLDESLKTRAKVISMWQVSDGKVFRVAQEDLKKLRHMVCTFTNNYPTRAGLLPGGVRNLLGTHANTDNHLKEHVYTRRKSQHSTSRHPPLPQLLPPTTSTFHCSN